MIQRIQTVFLLLALVCMGLFLWMPLIGVEAAKFSDFTQGYAIGHTLPIGDQPYIMFFNAILTGSAAGLLLIAIFAFKNRDFQMMLCWFAIVLMLSAQAFVYYKYLNKVFLGDVLLTYWNLLSVGAIVFLILSIVYIRKDEETIKSLDRLRD